jgi:hypothetical protein
MNIRLVPEIIFEKTKCLASGHASGNMDATPDDSSLGFSSSNVI